MASPQFDIMSYWLFGYGSLIWKPPPHVVERVPGYIKGFVRRFWQSSNDHRGTPERPGRVVTLITREFWSNLNDPHPYGEDDVVWGVAYRIDPKYAQEVKAYMDHREKNGYTEMDVMFHPSESGQQPFRTQVYVGLPGNEAFVGSEDPEHVATQIVTCYGPSGPNKDYLYYLWKSLQSVDVKATDPHIIDLVARAQRIERELGGPEWAPQLSTSLSPTFPCQPQSLARNVF